MAIDYDANEIIVSFSGTNPLSIRNWIDDLDAFQTSYPLCSSGCKVHKGFYNTYLSVQEQVLTLLKKYVSANPTAKISVTGHSLGNRIESKQFFVIVVVTNTTDVQVLL